VDGGKAASLDMALQRYRRCITQPILLTFVGGLLLVLACCYLCSSASPLYNVHTELEQTLQFGDHLGVISIVFPVVTCVPLLMDIVFDALFYSFKGIFLTERVVLLICNALPGVLYYALRMSVSKSETAVVFAVFCAFRECSFCTYVISVLMTSVTGMWKGSKVFVVVGIFYFSRVVCLLTAVHDENRRAKMVTYWILAFIVWLIGFVNGVRYFRAVWRAPRISPEEFLVCVYVVFLVMFLTYKLGSSRHNLTVLDFDKNILLNYNIVHTAILSFCILLPGRTAKNVGNELKRIKESKHAFVRYVSHEIRTPANVCSVGIGIVIETLQSLKLFSGELKEVLGQAQEAMYCVTETLNNLLEYESIDENTVELNLSAVKPVAFVRNALKLLQIQAKQNGIKFSLPSSGRTSCGSLDDCLLDVDALKMGQALRNVVANAIKFTPLDGHIDVQISPFCWVCHMDRQRRTTSAHVQQPWVRIDVIDSGAGMDEDILRRLEDGSSEDENNLLEPGQPFGFNLFVSKSIVHKHGGRVVVQSAGVGKGSTFSIDLPLSCWDGVNIHDDIISSATQKQFEVKDLMSWKSSNNIRNQNSQASAHSFGGISSRKVSPLDGSQEPSMSIASLMLLRNSSTLPEYVVLPNRVRKPRSPRPLLDLTQPVLALHSAYYGSSGNVAGSFPYPGAEMNSFKQDPNRGHAVRGFGDEVAVQFTVLEGSMESETGSNSSFRSFNSQSVVMQPNLRTHKLKPLDAEFSSSVKVDTGPVDKSCAHLLSGKLILCVDDSAVNLKMIAMLFKKLGAVCELAVNGKEAVDRVAAKCNLNVHNYDMIIMDNFMPVMTGPVACKMLRQMGFKGVIFGLTGHVLPTDMQEYYKAGVDYVFKKPLSVKEFTEVLQSRSLISQQYPAQNKIKFIEGDVAVVTGDATSAEGSPARRENMGTSPSFEKGSEDDEVEMDEGPTERLSSFTPRSLYLSPQTVRSVKIARNNSVSMETIEEVV
jgi:signal transduction histidine kinase